MFSRSLLATLALTLLAAILPNGGIAAETAATPPQAAGTKTAIFAMGCFWCAESDFEKVPGVTDVVSGYTGGTVPYPNYEQVSAGGTGHAEAIKVTYDPSQITYDKLLTVFWHNVDPVAVEAQFCDHGHQYRSAIFYGTDEERKIAEASKALLTESGRFSKPIATEIVQASAFYPAEEYHQHYSTKNPFAYRFYRYGCGRDARLKEIWGDEAGGHQS